MNAWSVVAGVLMSFSFCAQAHLDLHEQIDGCPPGVWYAGEQALGAPLRPGDEIVGYWKGVGWGFSGLEVSSGLNQFIIQADGRYEGRDYAKQGSGGFALSEPYTGSIYCIGLGQYAAWNDGESGLFFAVDLSMDGNLALVKSVEVGAPLDLHEGNILLRMRPQATLDGLATISGF